MEANSVVKSFMTEKILKSIFRIFIFDETSQKVYHEHFSVVYTMKLSWNISQCILAFTQKINFCIMNKIYTDIFFFFWIKIYFKNIFKIFFYHVTLLTMFYHIFRISLWVTSPLNFNGFSTNGCLRFHRRCIFWQKRGFLVEYIY